MQADSCPEVLIAHLQPHGFSAAFQLLHSPVRNVSPATCRRHVAGKHHYNRKVVVVGQTRAHAITARRSKQGGIGSSTSRSDQTALVSEGCMTLQPQQFRDVPSFEAHKQQQAHPLLLLAAALLAAANQQSQSAQASSHGCKQLLIGQTLWRCCGYPVCCG